MIPIAKPVITEKEKEKVLQVMDSGMLTSGKYVKEFEKKFAGYIGCKYGIATSSGTTALELALKSAGIGEGDKVITTPFTFIASSNSIFYTGAEPVFVDIDRNTYNIDPELIREKLAEEENIKALLIVHLYGLPCNMEEIMDIVAENELILIEDCAQAHGAKYNGKKVGGFGDVSIFSFYPTKNMTTGEGGIVLTGNKNIAEKARLLVNHGQSSRYYHEILGYNYRMTNIAAAIGLVQLEKLDKLNKRRQDNAVYLTEKLKNLSNIKIPYVPERCYHSYHQYTIKVNNRQEWLKHLQENEVGYGVHYPLPVHKQPFYKKRGFGNISLPVCEELSKKVLSIPVHPSLSEDDLQLIVKTIKNMK